MFCPEGYKTIAEVRCSVSTFEWNRVRHPDLTSSDGFENLVFDTIIENEALRICSPEGQILKISDDILEKIEIDEELKNERFPFAHFYGLVENFLEFPETESIRWTGMPLFFERASSSFNYFRRMGLSPNTKSQRI